MDNVVVFDARIAKEIGVEESILFYHIYGWVKYNSLNGKNIHDGKPWTFCSSSALASDSKFVFMSQDKIKRILNKMSQSGILERGNFNKTSMDRTLWYTIGEYGQSIVQKYSIDCAFLHNPLCENAQAIPTIINNNINKENISKRKVFVKPSVEEVRAYCIERGNNINAESFIDYYESKGWIVGKTPMKDWKSAIRNWERNNYGRGQNNQSGVGQTRFSEIDYGESDI